MTGSLRAATIAGCELAEGSHICAFFRGDDEAYRVLVPFIADGFARGERAVHVVAADRRGAHLGRLAAAGIDAKAAQRRGQLDLRSSADTYLRHGRFDPDRMLEVFARLAGTATAAGFARNRIVCSMDWVVQGRSHIDQIVEFEARVNAVWRRHPDVVVCVYDLAQFGGETVVEIVRTHPLVIIGGIVQPNPFFLPFEELLRERRGRRPMA